MLAIDVHEPISHFKSWRKSNGKIKDPVRCTNCWEGFDWQRAQPGNRDCDCPRCGRKGQVIQGGSPSLLKTGQAIRKILPEALKQERAISRRSTEALLF